MRPFIYGLILAAIVGIQACDTQGSLARRLSGSWTGAPEAIDVDGASSSQAILIYDFTNDDGSTGGTVALTAMLTASMPVNPLTDSVPAGVTDLTVSATASIQGTWKATGDDEVFLMLDPKSLVVSVDPESVAIASAGPTPGPEMMSLKSRVAALMKSRFAAAFERKVMTVHHLDDVEIHSDGEVMTWEAAGQDVALHRNK